MCVKKGMTRSQNRDINEEEKWGVGKGEEWRKGG